MLMNQCFNFNNAAKKKKTLTHNNKPFKTKTIISQYIHTYKKKSNK